MATEHDATKIVNNVAVLVGNAGYLSASVGALWLFLKGKAHELTLEHRKVVAMELMAEAFAKKAGIEVPKPKEEKKGVNSPLMTKCAKWAYFAGNMDGLSYVASKGVSEYALST